MVRRYLPVVLAGAFCAATALSTINAQDPDKPTTQPELKTNKQQASYGIGLTIGKQIGSDAEDIDLDAVVRGLRDAFSKAKPALSDDQVRAAMTTFAKEMQTKTEAKAKVAGGKNKGVGEAFLAANGKKEGVQTLPSGLQYKVLKAGTGVSPKATDKVKVHYHGTLIDGTVFDSSVDRKEPAEFPVNRVIAGWVEALQKMKVGDKWQLTIPSKLAYGEQGTPDGSIGPNSVLVFDVELLEILK